MNTKEKLIILLVACLINVSAAETAIDTVAVAQPPADTGRTTVIVAPESEQMRTSAISGQRKNLVVVRETKDTVFVLDKTSMYCMVKNWQKNFDILRQKSIGLSGGSTHGVSAVSIAPIKELIRLDPYLSRRHFDFRSFDYEPFLMSGGFGYIGLGDGFRLGGSGMSGQRNFSSDTFNGDSIIVLGVKTSFGGFLVEKTTVRDRWNMTIGGTMGGGSIKVIESEQHSTSWFVEGDDNLQIDDFEATFKNGNSANSGFFLFEPYCGISYTVFQFFHIGVNIAVPAFLSMEKFNIYTSDYFSLNPGVSFKLIFGNLG